MFPPSSGQREEARRHLRSLAARRHRWMLRPRRVLAPTLAAKAWYLLSAVVCRHQEQARAEGEKLGQVGASSIVASGAGSRKQVQAPTRIHFVWCCYIIMCLAHVQLSHDADAILCF